MDIIKPERTDSKLDWAMYYLTVGYIYLIIIPAYSMYSLYDSIAPIFRYPNIKYMWWKLTHRKEANRIKKLIRD